MALIMGKGKIDQSEVRIRVQGHLHSLGMTRVSSIALLGWKGEQQWECLLNWRKEG